MKYISNRNIGWLAGFLLTACQSEVVTVPDNDNALQVLSVGLNQDEGTRSEMTTDEIKQINVYTTTNDHKEIDANTLATYTNDGNAWSCTAPSELTTATYNIFAYYPPTRVDGGEAVTVLSASIPLRSISMPKMPSVARNRMTICITIKQINLRETMNKSRLLRHPRRSVSR